MFGDGFTVINDGWFKLGLIYLIGILDPRYRCVKRWLYKDANLHWIVFHYASLLAKCKITVYDSFTRKIGAYAIKKLSISGNESFHIKKYCLFKSSRIVVMDNI